jgi:hypothetical protein
MSLMARIDLLRSGSDTISLQKFYSNPSKAMMCCIVHVGEGVEWSPRTAHTGGLASFIEDSLDFLGSRFTEGNFVPIA